MTPLIAAGALRDRPWSGFALAIASAGVALVLRLRLAAWFPPGFPFVMFFPAIIGTSFVAGLRAGILCAVLSLLGAWYYLIPPIHSFTLDRGTVLPLLTFATVSAVAIGSIEVMQRALDRLGAERLLTRQLYDQQRMLFQELQHRVANNMAFVSGLLRLQKRRIAADPASAASAFDEAVARIETMGRIHRRLYDPAAANQALQAHLQDMCDELLRATGSDCVTCKVAVPALELELDRLLPLSLLVAEVITNSLKHGFAGRAQGNIAVTLESDAAGERVLVIRDDGVGLPADHDPAASPGLGMRIVQGLVAQIGGQISMASEGGTVTRVTLPA